MSAQKEAVMKLVLEEKGKGRFVGEALAALGVARSTYYRWKKSGGAQRGRASGAYPLTPEECEAIEAVKEAHPHLRHRQIQGVLQNEGTYLSFSAIYGHLKECGLVEPYERRAAPWESPRYEVWQRNLMWGCDWTKLRVGGLRWYLLTVIDFFSRLIIAHDIVPTVNASHIKRIYQRGRLSQGILLPSESKPELRVDQGSPNTSWVTKEFFEIIGADLSFARVRRPTDNAITERFYGTIKQEEIYLVGNYPDERSAREEIGGYVDYYNTDRPHQSLMNFTPGRVHEVNNKTVILNALKQIKKEARQRRKQYWRTLEKVTH